MRALLWRQLGDATSRAGQRAAVPLVRRHADPRIPSGVGHADPRIPSGVGQSKPALKRAMLTVRGSRERPSEKWRATAF
jgi:hypothetical protein